MKNQSNRLDESDYGFLVYGRNIADNGEQVIRAVLKTCRTQLRSKQVVRTIADLKKEEIDIVTAKHAGDYLPDGWFFDGRMYMNFDGEVKFVHPNL
jgi:hypothetical protein